MFQELETSRAVGALVAADVRDVIDSKRSAAALTSHPHRETAHDQRRIRGSSASRTPSPMNEKASNVRPIASAGMTTDVGLA